MEIPVYGGSADGDNFDTSRTPDSTQFLDCGCFTNTYEADIVTNVTGEEYYSHWYATWQCEAHSPDWYNKMFRS